MLNIAFPSASARVFALGALTVAALAASPSAYAADDIPEGAVVRITGISKQDAFFDSRKGITGLVCGVEEGGLSYKRGKFYGGSVTCGEAGNFYFYEAAFEVGPFGDYEALTGHAVGAPAVDSNSGDASSPWQRGAVVRITGLSQGDAHVGASSTLVGKVCTVMDSPLSSTGEPWFSGQLACGADGEWYFYQVSVEAATVAPSTTAPVATPGTVPAAPAAPTAAVSPFAAGKMVKVVDIAPADAFYATRASVIGRTCAVVETPLFVTGPDLYAGRLFCDDGKTWQVFQAKVAAP